MHIQTQGLICAALGASSIATLYPTALPGQRPSAQADTARVAAVRADSVSAVAGAQYGAGAFHRWFAGDGYRDLWTQSVRVPVLDLHSFAGGLHPLKEGGGMQTKNLRFETKSGEEYVFRLVEKKATGTPPELRATPLNWFFQDGVSASHPGASELAAPILVATGVLHPTAVLMWMPDDPALGEFRRDFGNKLGLIEEYPNVPKGPTEVAEREDKAKRADEKDSKGEKREKEREAGGKLAKDSAETKSDSARADDTRKGDEKPNTKDENKAVGFGSATKIIDSPELLKLLNTEAKEHVDAPAFLMARLSDFLINDNDRHAGQWKWAQLAADPKTDWVPIARDRDHAFVSYDGFENVIARFARSSLVGFNGRVNVAGLTSPNDLDERLLAGLEKSVWDSVARELRRRVTDSVIHAAILAMPAEYRATAPHIEAVLRQRRDAIPAAADEYYRELAVRVQVHGTDSPDRASIVRAADGSVAVHLESGGKSYFSRMFRPNETHELLVYLHDGNDTAVVSGNASKSILVRVIGGNGGNTFVDSSVVGGSRHPTRFYNAGETRGIEYGLDTLFERLPWEHRDGRLAEAIPNFGSALLPVAGLSDDRSIGIAPRLGVERYTYGFMERPYSSMLKLNAEYAPFWGGGRITFIGDRRFESTPLHTMLFCPCVRHAVHQLPRPRERDIRQHAAGHILRDAQSPVVGQSVDRVGVGFVDRRQHRPGNAVRHDGHGAQSVSLEGPSLRIRELQRSRRSAQRALRSARRPRQSDEGNQPSLRGRDWRVLPSGDGRPIRVRVSVGRTRLSARASAADASDFEHSRRRQEALGRLPILRGGDDRRPSDDALHRHAALRRRRLPLWDHRATRSAGAIQAHDPGAGRHCRRGRCGTGLRRRPIAGRLAFHDR